MPEPGASPPFGASLKNEDFARVLEEIADLLELSDGNAFRVLAYRNAARELRGTGHDVAALLAAGETLPKMPGIGADLEAKLREIFATGTPRPPSGSCVIPTRPASASCCACPGWAPSGCACSTSGSGWGPWPSWSRPSGPGACAPWGDSGRNRNSESSLRLKR